MNAPLPQMVQRPTTVSGMEPADAATAQHAWLALLRGEAAPDHPLTEQHWSGLLEEATRHHLRGVTYRKLADGPLADRVPIQVRERLRSFYLETATRNALYFRQTSQLVKELASRDIPVMLLKGVHLARFVYAEPGLRSMADIDIMVHREHLAEAERLFVDRGFGPLPRPDLAEFCSWSNHLAKLVKDGAPVVELHWSIERPTSPFPIDLEGLWQRSREATLDGAPVRLLSPEDLLLHLALHLSYHHRFDRAALKGVVDIATVLTVHANDINWTMLTARATAWGASGYLYATLRLANAILAAPVPEHVLQALPRQPADEEVVEVARRYILMPPVTLPKVYLALAQDGSLLGRAKLLLGAVFLPREKMESVYGLRPGTLLVYPYYGIRLGSLLVKRGGALLHTLLGTRAIQRTIDHDHDRRVLEQWGSAATAEASGRAVPRPG